MEPEGLFRRRRLPHWDVPGATFFVTACLHDSMPAQGLLDIDRYRARLARQPRPGDIDPEEWEVRQAKRLFARADEWLDRRPAVRLLEDPRLAALVVESINHFAGQRYDVWAYAVMPSHFHWVFRPRDEWVASLGAGAEKRTPRERVMHTLKLRTALECNKARGRKGTFWQDEAYDHCVRDEEELGRIIGYVEMNPVRAGLVSSPGDWLYSSAAERTEKGLSCWDPVPR
jgi:type I restriction enzyme R subunit